MTDALRRLGVAVSTTIALLAPAHAQTVERAEGTGNALWARSTLEQMERLDSRRARLCPDLYPPSAASIAMAELRRIVKTVGKAALTFFTMGAM